MKAFQIFQNISAETGGQIIEFFREEDRDTYRATLASLAQQRRLRPIFVQRKSRDAQIAWMLKTLQLKQCDGVCEHLLQTWLMKGYQDVLVAFLDGVGIEHDGKGEVEDLPDEVDAKKLKSTVDSLLGEYDHELVAIYLHTFNLQKLDGWEAITALLDSDDRLKLGAAEEEPEPEPEPEPTKTEEPEAVEETPAAEEAASEEEPESEEEAEAEPEEDSEEDGEPEEPEAKKDGDEE